MHLRIHGGRPPQGVIDFSTPVNPLGPPPELEDSIRSSLESGAHRAYPDYDYREFREAVSLFYDIEADRVVPLNGAGEALTLAIAAFKPDKLVTVEPTFGDHPRVIGFLGVKWITVPLREHMDGYELDPRVVCGVPRDMLRGSVILLSNPNNPTGHVSTPRAIAEIVECARDSVILVDEAFMDFAGREYSSLYMGLDNVIVIRSLTKSLAVPGLRVGFAYAHSKNLALKLEAVRQPWNVNAIASASIARVLGEEPERIKLHLERAREVIRAEGSWLAAQLRRLGLRVYGSSAPYMLIRHGIPHPKLQRRLNSLGVHVRDASSFMYLTPYHSRVSIRLRRENEVLVRALEACFSEADSGV